MTWQKVALTAARVALVNFGIDPEIFLSGVAEETGISKREFFDQLRADDKKATEKLLSARARRKAALEAED